MKSQFIYYSLTAIALDQVDDINEGFIRNHISDTIFDDVNGRSLDQEQRRAVLCDAQSNLTVAGAGSGKTLTICGKVKYLLETGRAKVYDILLMSYSRASAEDLAGKIEKICPGMRVGTFHSLGLEILTAANGAKLTIEDQFKSYIQEFFNAELPKNPGLAAAVFRFFSYYLYTSTDDDKKYSSEGERYADLKTADFKTMKDRLLALNTNADRRETLKKELVKSYEELAIANFLFINGVNYEYERPYEFDTNTVDKRQYTPDFYLPDYNLYLEHYGINREGKAPQYTEAASAEYVAGMRWKRNLHAQHQTTCLETFSYQFSEGTIFDDLTKQLVDKGVVFRPLDRKEIVNALHSIYNGTEFTSFYNLVMTFLSLYKSQYPNEKGFDLLKERSLGSVFDNQRAAVFLDICKAIYTYYISRLRSEGKIDFDDMILKSITALDQLDGFKYKYIIVDEFQDISQSRTRFLKKLIEHGNSELFAVGDDWQAIYRFAGCDISVFLNFENLFSGAVINYITSTHRNSAELQKVVEPFITRNPEQYKKHIQSAIHQSNPVRIIYHDMNRTAAFEDALKNIAAENPQAKVLILGRNRHDIDAMVSYDIQVFDYETVRHKKYPRLDLTYKTVHGSKGLESDYVILISCEDSKNGFPNQMEDDILLSLVLGGKGGFLYAEERRLFYVALTRTRSVVYLLVDKNKPSVFIKEIESSCVSLNPELKMTEDSSNAFSCPWCKAGKLIIRRSPRDNKSFYGCTNFPYCTYTNNNLKAVQSNKRCPICGDFMVIRKGQYGVFFGCSQYPRCTYTEQIQRHT